MGRVFLNRTLQELYWAWSYVQKCRRKGILCDEKWFTFEGFVQENKIRYLRAKVKWKHYKRVALRKRDDKPAPLKLNNIRFKRKIMELGFTKENTVFTSPSDSMKYHIRTHTYMFEGQMLGTRDIKNILKKRGIEISMEQIVLRLAKGIDLFEPNEKAKIKWKGKYRSYEEIAQLEKVSYALLKQRNYKVNNIRKALDYCRQWEGYPVYEFERQQLRQYEICAIIAERIGIDSATINGRFKKFGMNLQMLTAPLGAKLTVRKTLYAIKDGVETRFDSIELASQALGLHAGNISLALHGKIVHSGGYKFRLEGGQYTTSPILTMDEQMEQARSIAKNNSLQRHASLARHCDACGQDKPKEEFEIRNFRRCKECVARERGIVRFGLERERREKFTAGLLWCSDCRAYKPLIEFNKNKAYHTGYATICRFHSKQRARLKKYGTEEIFQAQQAVNLMKEKLRAK